MKTEAEIVEVMEKLGQRYDDPKYKGQYLGFTEAIRGTQMQVLLWVLDRVPPPFSYPKE